MPTGGETARELIPAAAAAGYVHLPGLYLGDGFIARGPRALCLRILCDARYPGIIGECVRSLRSVRPHNRVNVFRRRPTRCVVVQCYSTMWAELIPQHGRGRKHERRIVLEPWQVTLTSRFPKALVRGLLQSDGSRYTNTVRHSDCASSYPRYEFTNRSEDIKRTFAITWPLVASGGREEHLGRAPRCGCRAR